jgi:hypothetical protein
MTDKELVDLDPDYLKWGFEEHLDLCRCCGDEVYHFKEKGHEYHLLISHDGNEYYIDKEEIKLEDLMDNAPKGVLDFLIYNMERL